MTIVAYCSVSPIYLWSFVIYTHSCVHAYISANTQPRTWKSILEIRYHYKLGTIRYHYCWGTIINSLAKRDFAQSIGKCVQKMAKMLHQLKSKLTHIQLCLLCIIMYVTLEHCLKYCSKQLLSLQSSIEVTY